MILQDLPMWISLPFLFIVGTVIGSFLNVCIHRLPKHDRLWDQLRGLSWPPSHCPKCKTRIARGDNIPILGWLKLRGRCRSCSLRISPRYPLIELGNGLLFVLVYWIEVPANLRGGGGSSLHSMYGPQMFDIWTTAGWIHWRYVYHMVMFEALVVATFIDFDEMIIPDGSTVPAMMVGILGGWGLGQVFLVPVWFQNSRDLIIWKSFTPEWFHPLLSGPDLPAWISAHPHWHGLAVSIAGCLVGGGIVWAVRIIGHWVLKREAMGFGDVVLMAMVGSFVGWQPALVIFFIAPFCALAFILVALLTRRGQEIPYGPYLSLGTLVLILGWDKIWPKVERIFALGIGMPIFAVVMPVLLAGSLLLIQLGKRMLGISTTPAPEYIEEWRSADQLQYLAGENVDDQQGRWKTEQWPGSQSGRGTFFENQWRNGG
ncbi:MAG: A24 family peptidase [Planctomycetaceae bacterium]